MNVRSVTQPPVRTLISQAHIIDDPSSALATAADLGSAAEPVYSSDRSPEKFDHFVNIVASRPSIEVNPHLWSWQAEALDAWHQSRCRGVVEAVTGAGKTMIGITAAFEAFRQGIKVLVLVPTAELQTQWQQRLMETLPQADVGTLGNGRKDSLSSCDILVAIINSATRGDLLKEHSKGLLIADECHRYAAQSFSKALQSDFRYRLGLTATYQRPDKANTKVLDPYFGVVVFQMWYDRALLDGVIAEFDIAFVGVSLTNSERGDYQTASSAISKFGMSLKNKLNLQDVSFDQFMLTIQSLAKRKNDPSPVVFMARKYLEAVVKRQQVLTNAKNKMKVLEGIAPVIAESRGTLVFSQTVDSSTQAARLLQRSRIETKSVSSSSKPHERRGAMQLFANGLAKVLCAPRILDEGIDVPDSDLAVVLSGSKQPRQTIQRLGRIIRRKADGRHGRFVVLYAINTIEDETPNRDQQFGAVVPSARRVADFNETQIRELRKFLRAPAPDMRDALGPSLPRTEETEGEASTWETAVSVDDSPPTVGEPNSVNAPETPNVIPQPFVLLKEVDDEGELPEVLRKVPDPDDLVGLYLKQISQFPLLSAEEEVEVAQRIEAGMYADYLLGLGRYSTRRERHDLEWVRTDGRAALDQMVSSNLRLVVSIAKRYAGRKLSLLDLIQEGNLGLVRAAQKFDYSQGTKFSTYATWWIRQGIDRGIGDFANTIRIPIHVVEKFPDFWNCMKDEESRAACTHDHSKAEAALRMQPASLDAYLDLQWDGHYAESLQSFDDRIADPKVFTVDPEHSVLAKEHTTMVNALLGLLSERDAEVVRCRFGWIDGEPQTLEEIGKKFDVTRERIRQIVNNSVALIRANLGVWAQARSQVSPEPAP
ncbi:MULTISPECIES: sigma-70 family RNA polymerase sigma factor [unclassified Brevibacterium]|uniref:sigma-70 family RNA polymerase sigma factor n=1 Tax=unclassified Brevibacterium TaxID=2614124 RepID=UPI001E4F4A40|nr:MULTISPECIES: sigma-70 family RNA polymerase sigma factor [unclassified Brevibacterium]MDK8435097.1 sigma-70 family RNA polymerase sigma factor [Brevibacterium sp. H-BE7]